MAIIEGTTGLPVVDGVTVAGTQSIDGNIYLPRSDGQRNQRVALYAANGNALLTTADPGYVREIGNNTLLLDGTVVWAASIAANQVRNADVALPTYLAANAKVLVWVRNPSTITALGYKVQVKETISSTDYYAELASGSVAASTLKAFVVEGGLLGGGLRIAFDNTTLLGVGEGFTAEVRVRLF